MIKSVCRIRARIQCISCFTKIGRAFQFDMPRAVASCATHYSSFLASPVTKLVHAHISYLARMSQLACGRYYTRNTHSWGCMLLVYVVRYANTWYMPRCMTVFWSTLGTMPPSRQQVCYFLLPECFSRFPWSLNSMKACPIQPETKLLQTSRFVSTPGISQIQKGREHC